MSKKTIKVRVPVTVKRTISVRLPEYIWLKTNERTIFEDLLSSGQERVREIEDTDQRGGKKYTLIYKLLKVKHR